MFDCVLNTGTSRFWLELYFYFFFQFSTCKFLNFSILLTILNQYSKILKTLVKANFNRDVFKVNIKHIRMNSNVVFLKISVRNPRETLALEQSCI